MPPAGSRPRAMVLHEIWRGLSGVDALTGAHGGPLSRTVKLILDPLVIRPVRHPECAGPMVTAETAETLRDLITEAAGTLAATAAWFAVFKRRRRLAGITDGHPQDRYFQRCFELATLTGPPDPSTAADVARDALAEIHDADGRGTADLRAYVADAGRAAALTASLAAAWAARGDGPPAHRPSGADLREFLDACPDGEGGDRLAALVRARAGTAEGRALWTGPAAERLGLTADGEPAAPHLGAAGAPVPAAPFDRSVYQRVHTTLRTAADRAALPRVPDLVDAEIGRACAPWALADESLRVAATLGARLAQDLDPIGAVPPPSTTRAGDALNARWRREAYVLRARRMTVDPAADRGPLGDLAADLRRPQWPYMRRLWARLHGRDVLRVEAVVAGDGIRDLWDLLDGVGRSVILDHRDRLRHALGAAGSSAGAPAGTPATALATAPADTRDGSPA